MNVSYHWLHVHLRFVSLFYNAGDAQYLFTQSFIKNTSPASREWTSVRVLSSSLHSLTLQDITDLDRVSKTERLNQMPHVTSAYIGQHQHMNIHTHTHTSFLHYHSTHTVLIAPCEGHKGPLITGMGSFKSGRRTQCCSCRMERN